VESSCERSRSLVLTAVVNTVSNVCRQHAVLVSISTGDGTVIVRRNIKQTTQLRMFRVIRIRGIIFIPFAPLMPERANN
jgi:hypothetical protein